LKKRAREPQGNSTCRRAGSRKTTRANGN